MLQFPPSLARSGQEIFLRRSWQFRGYLSFRSKTVSSLIFHQIFRYTAPHCQIFKPLYIQHWSHFITGLPYSMFMCVLLPKNCRAVLFSGYPILITQWLEQPWLVTCSCFHVSLFSLAAFKWPVHQLLCRWPFIKWLGPVKIASGLGSWMVYIYFIIATICWT